MADDSTGVREYMLRGEWFMTEDIASPRNLVPGLWHNAADVHDRRILLVWGDGIGARKPLCCPCVLDKDGVAVPSDRVKSVRQLPTGTHWLPLWPLEPTDRLPGAYGPDVASYIARVEQGGAG